MANSYTVLADLRAGRCSTAAEVRLLRFWEARNINKNGQLMSLEMLLIDEHSTVVQGSVPASWQLTFRGRLNEGSVYALSGFDVTRSSPKYKLTDSPVSIRFNKGTDFRKLAATSWMNPTEHFRFRPFEQILASANSGKQLPDVMGELRAIKSTITDRLPWAQRVMLTLCLESDVDVCVSMFDSWALAFHEKFDGYGKEPKIVLVTSINPKIVSEAYNRLPGGGEDQEGYSTKVVHAQKIEPLTVTELNNFVLTGDPQIIEFLCTAKITGVQQDEGWCYIGCSICSKKLIQDESSFTCGSCNLPNAVAELKYRVVFFVSNVTGIAAFVGFDKEVVKLTNILASEAAQIVGVGVNAEVGTDLRRSFPAIVGNTYTFQLKLTDFNFTPNHQTFTISHIFPSRELAPTPTFAEGAEDDGAQPVLQPFSPGSDSRGTSSCKVTDQSIKSDDPHAVLETAGKEVPDMEENALKKTRVE